MLTQFFVEDLPTEVGAGYVFEGDDADHAIRVLRTKVGDIFSLSDGRGTWAHVKAVEVTKKFIVVSVIEAGHQEKLSTQFTVVQALPKSDRIKEALELLTEGGVDHIIPWQSARSIGKGDKSEKWETTLREASKQSRRNWIPTIASLATTAQIVSEIPAHDLALVLHESATTKLSSVVKGSPARVLIIVGPEGGLTDEEVDAFKGAGAKVVLMGRPILRSAHAGLAALSAAATALKVW